MSNSVMTKVAIVFYSMFVSKLAKAVQAGAHAVPGVQADLYQVQETLGDELLTKRHAPPKPDLPIATPEVLKDADGILLGFPSHFGMVPAQMKPLFDACGGLWVKGDLVGKPCGVFFSTASQGGGQETTAMSTTPFIAHHGMIFEPIGFRSPLMDCNDEMHGGSLWGAGTIANSDKSRQPSTLEVEIARIQGESFAETTKKLSS